MYTTELRVSDYVKRFYKFTCNAYWIKIYDANTKALLFERSIHNDNWFDKEHQKIIKAMNELEKAVFEVIR